MIGNSNVHVDAFSHPNRFLGVDNVAYWATVSTSNETNGSKTTGFMQLVGDAINGYDVTRYEGYTALPSNQSALAPDGANYYVNGSHTMAGTAPGSPGQAGLKTLTIMGSGTLQVDNNFHIQNILLQEGSGDYTIYLPTSQITHDVWGAQGRAALTLHQYRTTGDLIIDANLHSAQLITTGPGKSIIRSASAHSLLTELLVQEGRLQLESNALSTVTVANIYAGNLGGSGQVGTSNTVLNVYHGGTLDATPTAHITESGLRGLQIYGSVIMDKDAALAMTLTSDVLSGNYNALRVTASNPLNTVVNLDGDLQVTLQDHFSGERWIVLLETNGLIDGSFASVNGEAFGLGNHFVLSYGGADYDFYLHYDHDLGGGMTALALQAIPEPSTITLLLGVIMSGVLWLRRSRKKTVE